jgi:aspartyl-tRNA(Asn)/glutamyl-tRNA(Gln) amidotransferase subunit C
MDTETVKRVGKIAHIDLTDEELKRFGSEIEKIFGLLNSLNNAPECDDLCFDPVGVHDILRDDVPVVCNDAEEILKGMSTYNGLVRGPKIV